CQPQINLGGVRVGVPHLRRSGSWWTRTQPLRAGLTCGAPPALVRRAPKDFSSFCVILEGMSTEPTYYLQLRTDNFVHALLAIPFSPAGCAPNTRSNRLSTYRNCRCKSNVCSSSAGLRYFVMRASLATLSRKLPSDSHAAMAFSCTAL